MPFFQDRVDSGKRKVKNLLELLLGRPKSSPLCLKTGNLVLRSAETPVEDEGGGGGGGEESQREKI